MVTRLGAEQPVELFAPCLGAGSIGGKRVSAYVELGCDEAQRDLGNGLSRSQQAAGVAERAELQRIAELVGGTPTAVDVGKVIPADHFVSS